MAAAEETFQRLVAQLDYPMFIATVAAGGERAGCLIGFATQCQHRPAALPRGHLGQEPHVPGGGRRGHDGDPPRARGCAGDLAELFGGETGDEVDKFARAEWREGPGGVPLLDGCPNRFVGRIVERIDFGDHVGMVLEPFFAEADEDSAQLGFHRAKRIEPGHEA